MHIDIQSEWQKHQAICEQIYTKGLSSYMSTLDQGALRTAATEGKRVVSCIDERVEGNLHVAGSFGLMDLKVAKQAVEEGKITGITSHSDCGAMALVYRRRHELADGTPLEASMLNQFAQDATMDLAEELGIEYAGHVDAAMMHGPQGLHIARAVYYHDTPFFNPWQVPALPPGFVISRSVLDEEEALANAELSFAIAFGGHGFGPLLNEENPLLLVAVGSEGLKEELQELVKKYASRVKLEVLPLA